MAITLPAAVVNVASADSGTDTTTIVEASAFTGVSKYAMVYNTTRSKKGKVSVVNSTSSLTIAAAITAQTTGDAITITTPIQINGAYDSGTATSGSATTLTDTGKSWTVNAYADRIIYIAAGTGVGASAVILSNTATVITVEKFYKFDTSAKNWTSVTPDNTSQYKICYNCADIIAAVGTVASWQDSTVAKTLVLTTGIYIPSGGYFGDVDKRILITYRDGSIDTDAGSFFQMGALNNSYNGTRGGSIALELQSSGGAGYHELYWLGRFNLFGTAAAVQKSFADSVNIHARVNLYSPGGNGLQIVDTVFTRISVQFQAVDAIKAASFNVAGGYMEAAPYHFTDNVGNGVFPASPRAEASVAGMNGGDVFDARHTGTFDDGVTVRTPVFLYGFNAPKGVAYWWRTKIKSATYSALTNFFTWYTTVTEVPSGVIWLGTTISLNTYNSAGSALGSVAFGVVKQSDGTGQIVIAKGNSGANYAPTMARFITTTAGGAYVGPFGASEGVFVRCHKMYQTTSIPLGTPYTTSIKVDYGPYYIYCMKYGYKYSKQSRAYAYSDGATENIYLDTNPYIVQATQATALAYSGLTTTGASSLIVVSAARTVQELYDYSQAWLMDQMTTSDTAYAEPITTADGVTFTLTPGWRLEGVENITFGSDRLAGGTIALDTPGTVSPVLGATTLEFQTAGTYVMSDADFGGAVVLTNTSGGSVTVELPSGVSYTNTGPNITISEPQVYQSVTITGLTTNSRVQIYDTTSSTELFNGVVATTSKVWTDGTPAAGTREIRVRISYVSGATAKNFIEATIGTCGITEPSNAISYLVSQTDDNVYIANAVTGSGVTGITFTDAATDLVNIDIDSGATTWQDIYAAFVYWIYTEAGIADDIAYIKAVDVANYLLTSMKVKNTSSPSVALTITGGFGRDTTSGTIVDIVDTTGGSVFPLVDHVVSSVVTVGGENIITGDIADIPTAAEVAQQVWAETEGKITYLNSATKI